MATVTQHGNNDPAPGTAAQSASAEAGKRTFRDVLAELDACARSTAEKGRSFERLVKAFLERDKAQAQRFSNVWLWPDWPGNQNQHDIGIDIVAEERDGGDLVAIQCKFYGPTTQISKTHVDSFLGAYGAPKFSKGIFVSTSDLWTGTAEKAIANFGKPVARWGPDIFENSSIDWSTFDLDVPADLSVRQTKNLRDYQDAALQDTITGFEDHDRGKLIMACGSGKTFTALRIAERVAGTGGTVLFLTPSISLLSQSLIDWANDADLPLKPFAVCSDIHAGKRSSDDGDMSPYDLIETPSTNPEKLTAGFRRADRRNNMTVVFSTYQSLDIVAEAQKQSNGVPEFDLIICDEAHRTTGVSAKQLTGKDESNFQRVHDNGFVAGKKRLYMTATPRIYGDRARRKANESQLVLASMDDAKLYGPEFHRLGFGMAIDLGILSDYKVVIFNVDQEQTGIDLDALLSDSDNEVNMDNGARMVGCWNGLGKRAAAGLDFSGDDQPAKRAVAFSNTIQQSKQFEEYFPQVIEACINAAGDNPENALSCEVGHVDGKQNALYRAERLAWLRQEPEAGVCRILSNARCLTEGIDVPALDAILFLNPRKSEIDVVQAVGRVMRRSPGKQYGYIILPIAQAPGTTPQESVNESSYKAVWQVINAISAHDDRFEAKINQLALTLERPDHDDYNTGGSIGDPGEPGSSDLAGEEGIQGKLLIAGSPELRDAILAKVVDKYADPRYWERWADTIRAISRRHEARIRALVGGPDPEVRETFQGFLTGIRNNLNDGITDDDAISMLSQHLVSRPVFDALFEDYAFTALNPVSRAMQDTLESLEERGLEKETAELDSFYRDVRVCVQGLTSAAARQKIIAELYQRFFQLALEDVAKRMGIVHTPIEVVDYVVRSVEDVMQREFGVSVSDEGVHVIDPFVGTGTFITRLLQSGLIKDADLRRKYESELHANDIMLLAYYIAAVNIEAAYHDRAGADEYAPFEGIVLTDTFQSAEEGDPMDEALFPRNNERIERQKALDIRVVIGNPPWSATNTRPYPTIDGKIQRQYAEPSATKHLSALYDPYVRAIRQASDRVQSSPEGGVVAFVTNGGFIDSNAFDGFRKALVAEFHAVYCYNLRGDARTSGDQRQREGGGIFDSGSRAGVAILVLVKKPGPSTAATINYHDIGDYLTREQKLDILDESRLVTTQWQAITPNEHGDWIKQRNDSFQTLRPLVHDDGATDAKGQAPIFDLPAPGLITGRDVWCYNSSDENLRTNVRNSVEFYNEQVAAFQKTNPTGTAPQREKLARAFATQDPRKFHWYEKNYREMGNGVRYTLNDADFTVGCYRPFFKQRMYFSWQLNNRPGRFPEIFPSRDGNNLGICIANKGASSPFHVLMTTGIPDFHLTGDSIYFPRYRYVPAQALMRSPDVDNPELERISNINPEAVAQFREHYGDDGISDDDLFYYTYGMLHCQQWREAFADDLTKAPARIPMAATADDFWAFVEAGRQLADLHVNYETVDPHDLEEIYAPGWNAAATGAYRVGKMSYASRRPNLDPTRIIYNAGITLAGIPEHAHEYRLGSRSALDWLIDRYQVTTHKASGIVNDPNDWAAEHDDPRYILDLVKRVTTVSVRTVDIVRNLPYQKFDSRVELLADHWPFVPEAPVDAERFRKLADQWEDETMYLSNPHQMARHPAYQEILGMGIAAVPLILDRMKDRGGHWFSTLRAITAADPVPPQDRGNVPAMTLAWLAWGERNGYA